MRMIPTILAAAAAAVFAAPLAAEDPPVPYWASIRANEVNMRVGPGEDYMISWVYHRAHLPLKVVRVKEGWRFVRDQDGAQGWILARFLSRERDAVVVGKEPAAMRDSPSDNGRLLWKVAPGVIGLVGDCTDGWCPMTIGERKGFVQQAHLWGAGEP